MLKSHLLILCDSQLSTSQVQEIKAQRVALRKTHVSPSYFESSHDVEFRAAVVHMNGTRKQHPQWMPQKEAVLSNKIVQEMANVSRSSTSRKISPRLQAAALSKQTEQVDAVRMDAASQIVSLAKQVGSTARSADHSLWTLNVFWCIPNACAFSGGDIMSAAAAGVYRALRFCQVHARATVTFLLAPSPIGCEVGGERETFEAAFRNIKRWRQALCAGSTVCLTDFMPHAVGCWTCVAKSALESTSEEGRTNTSSSSVAAVTGDGGGGGDGGASCADLEFHVAVPDLRFTLERALRVGDAVKGNFEVCANARGLAGGDAFCASVHVLKNSATASYFRNCFINAVCSGARDLVPWNCGRSHDCKWR